MLNYVLHKLKSLVCILVAINIVAGLVYIQGDTVGSDTTSQVSNQAASQLHVFYPPNLTFSDQIKKYIDSVDSLSFAWSRLDVANPQVLNIAKGQNGNYSFYYPPDYLQPVEYAKGKGKSIQISVYANKSDAVALLPYTDKRSSIIQAVVSTLQQDISQGQGIYYDGVVIDFEGLQNNGIDGNPILYEGQTIGAYFLQFLTELKTQLNTAGKKLYVAVNPPVNFDGYDYGAILKVADRLIMMAHDYEPSVDLQKDQILQYTGFEAINPINSNAPIRRVKQALDAIRNSAGVNADLSKVWLQIALDSTQWQYALSNPNEWDSLSDTTMSTGGPDTPSYSNIEARVANTDGFGINITYGYNNELQCPFLQYYNTSKRTWNILLYEDSTSVAAKMDLAKSYGLGGISIWSMKNIPDWNDSNSKQFRLDVWNTIISKIKQPYTPPTGSDPTVKFTDRTVEKAVRDNLGKPSGNITAYDVKSIFRLQLPTGVKSLNDLKYLTNLEYLYAEKLGLKDLTQLGALTNLRVLDLQDNMITNISPLKKLTKIQILKLSGNRITDMSSLSALTDLRELYMDNNGLKSISTLSGLKNLKKFGKLNLDKNSITDITPLSGLKNLYSLSMDLNNASNIKALGGLTGLKRLVLTNNKIIDIQPLKNLKNLELIYLSGNKIGDLRPLSGLTILKELSFNRNVVSDIKPVATLTNLEALYMKNNKISNLSPLKGLLNLHTLYISGNPLKDLSPIEELNGQLMDCDFSF